MSSNGAKVDDVDGVRSISVDNVLASYDRLGIDNWSDQRLIAAVSNVIAEPREGPADSFVLHAPLELVARSRLLPLVAPMARRGARLRLLNLAAGYEASGPPLGAGSDDLSPLSREDLAAPLPALLRALDDGDLVAVDRTAQHIVGSVIDPVDLVRGLADALIARTSAAAHAPILLSYLLAGGPTSRALLPLLRPMAREIARMPAARIRWYDDALPATAAGGVTAPRLEQVLAEAPRLGVPGSAFIHPLMMQVDEGGFAAERLGPVMLESTKRGADAARSVLRIAVRSMLDDNPDHAKYGWTHCLTMPQAVLALAPHLDRPDRALAVAATHVLGFRTALGATDLDPASTLPSGGRPQWERATALASDAATRHDAHIVKYSLAVIEGSCADQEAADLYLSAGERLLEIWGAPGDDPDDTLAHQS